MFSVKTSPLLSPPHSRGWWVMFKPALWPIPMTKCITHLPNYLVRVEGGAIHSTYTVYSCRWRVSWRLQGHRVRADADKVQTAHLAYGPDTGAAPDHPPPPDPPPRHLTLHITLQQALANRCSRLGCRPRHARKQTLIVDPPSVISPFLLLLLFFFFLPTPLSSSPDSPGEQSRGPNLNT